MELKVIKSANEIEDICISYGLCKILEDNDIDYILKDNKSMYSIYIDNDIDIEDIEYYEVDRYKVWNFNSGLNGGEIINNIRFVNEFIGENISDIIEYFLHGKTRNEYSLINSIAIGNVYYGCGIRGSNKEKKLKMNPVKKALSILGWIFGCSYCKTKYIEITTILKPTNTTELRKPFNFTYTDKETGNIKPLTKLSNDCGIVISARLYIETLLKYNLLKENYSDIIFIQNIPAGNKPLSEKTYYSKILNLSNELLDDLLYKTKIQDESIINSKISTCKYIMNMGNYKKYSDMIKTFSKENQKLKQNYKEEMLSMYSEIIKEINENEGIKKLGNGLNRLIRNNMGHDIKVKLYSVSNEKHFLRAIRDLINIYSREFKESNSKIINDIEFNSIIKLIDSKDKAKIASDVVLSISSVFIITKNLN